tara:strand:- start:1583 stop:2833 length:1251 start_codon:yes stop_codon:yes gene_type:complete
MGYAADLHLHSPYAYACSKNLTLENLSAWAKLKGIDLLACGDFTHPVWYGELRRKLTPTGSGLYGFKGVHFVLGTEVCCIYRQGGRSRRVHLLLFAPDFDTVDRLNLALAAGKNKLESNGRPTLSLSARDFTALVLEVNPDCMVIPAHVWTPWFGVFGSKSGFDSLKECFQDLTPNIHALETGLSSDPAMMWPIREMDQKTIVSFSDAHSLPKLGRELTVFEGELSYRGLSEALANQRIAYTAEFYPQEGKYHYDGHRKCGVRQSPEDTRRLGGRCPVCRRPLTLGVLSRAQRMADGGRETSTVRDGFVRHEGARPPFIRLVPLQEIIAETLGQGTATKRVGAEYRRISQELGSELQVLTGATAADLERVAGERLAQAVIRARAGDVRIDPGYDGVYGRVRVWPDPPAGSPTLVQS